MSIAGNMPVGLRAMDKAKEEKLQILLDDVWDWAFCPLRVWWRRTGLAPDVAEVEGKRTGDQLVRESIRTATKIYYRFNGKEQKYNFGQSLGLVWKRWLDGWQIDAGIAKALVDYHQRRRSILSRFEDGQITNREGKRYKRPMWTRFWREMAESSGLTSLRKSIDSQQRKIGLGELTITDDEYYQAPIGLADAFANSMDIANKLELPERESVVGVNVPMIVELPSVRMLCRADLVTREGVSKRRGRPRKDGGEPAKIIKLGYEQFLFDEVLPPPYSLARDLRVLALGQAVPDGLDFGSDKTAVEAVTVRHLFSGERQDFHPKIGDGSDLLESLARAVITGVRGGTYVPRMVCGWKACGDCEYRILCFSESGVMDVFNPPLMAQIESSQVFQGKMKEFLRGSRTERRTGEILRSFLEFMAKSPGLTPEGALWMLDNLEAES